MPSAVDKTIGACSVAAGAVHGVVAPAHFEEWWGYGLFFIAAGAFQVLFGLALLTDAVNAKDFGPGADRARRITFALGVTANVAILLLYVVTRTSGIPWFGPEADEVEPVGALDVIAGVLEVVVVAGSTWRWLRPQDAAPSMQPKE